MIHSLTPIPHAYRVDGPFYAGEYPGMPHRSDAAVKVRRFLDFGITDFVDLTQPGELCPYEEFLPPTVHRHSFPVPDLGVPSRFEVMAQILGTINRLLNTGHRVYLHCFGGIGRTGTVVASWLGVQHHLCGSEALELFQKFWRTCPKASYRLSPETNVQREFVKAFLASPCPVERYTQFHRYLSFPKRRTRFRGCLLGGAVGDAMGQVARGNRSGNMTDYSILDRPTPREKSQELFGNHYQGRITGATQTTLFTAEGLLRGIVQYRVQGTGMNLASSIFRSYLRWMLTQGKRSECPAYQEDAFYKFLATGWLFSLREQWRACESSASSLQALSTVTDGPFVLADNRRNTSDGLVRVAPIGMYLVGQWSGKSAFRYTLNHVFAEGARAAAWTEGRPTAYLAAGFVAVLVYLLLENYSLPDALDRGQRQLSDFVSGRGTPEGFLNVPDLREGAQAISSAVLHADHLAQTDPEKELTSDAAFVNGQSPDDAAQVLSLALYSTLSALAKKESPVKQVEEGITRAASLEGWGTGTTALCGTLLGATLGESAFPERWLAPLELRDVLGQVAEDLATVFEWDIAPDGLALDNAFYQSRYPGW